MIVIKPAAIVTNPRTYFMSFYLLHTNIVRSYIYIPYSKLTCMRGMKYYTYSMQSLHGSW